MRVERGPDWRWGNQDGGLGSVGVIIGGERSGWVSVQWPSGTSNGYRVGDVGMYDLQLAVSNGSRPSRGRPAHQLAKQGQAAEGQGCGASVAARPRARERCWCIDQFGDVMEVPA